MRLVLVSNYLNVHQRPICDALIDQLGVDNFAFVATTPFNQLRIHSGYVDMNREGFVVRAYEDFDAACSAAIEADVLIGIPYSDPNIIDLRLKTPHSGPTFVYSERLLKRGRWMRYVPQKIGRVHRAFINYQHDDSFHVLCASAFTSYDLSIFGFPSDKCWKWGYFPAVPNDLPPTRTDDRPASLVWIGRLIDWKRPFMPLRLAKRLLSDKRSFHLTMIGDGKLRQSLDEYIKDYALSEYVTLTGSIPNREVHDILSSADIFLFTSNRKEGWGAVLNEAMGHGCAPVASSLAGSTPYLIDDNINGRIFIDGDDDDFYQCVVDMLDDRAFSQDMGFNAYLTMKKYWNPDHAAKSIIKLANSIQSKEDSVMQKGPCSPAGITTDSWFGGLHG